MKLRITIEWENGMPIETLHGVMPKNAALEVAQSIAKAFEREDDLFFDDVDGVEEVLTLDELLDF